MKPNLKKAGLAFVVVLAVSAVAAPAASAKAFSFKSAVAHTTVVGETLAGSEEVFHIDTGTVRCPTVAYDGTTNATSVSEVTIQPTYPKISDPNPCKLELGGVLIGNAEIEMNGCDYLFTVGTLEGGNFEGKVDIVCPVGASITITVKLGGMTKCILHIPAQTNLTTVTYTNVSPVGKPKHLHIDVNLSGITYTQTEGTGAGKCAEQGATHTTNGAYTGTVTLKGFDTVGVQKDIFVE